MLIVVLSVLCLISRSLPGGLRRAYMGHLIRMANYIVEFGKHGKNAAKIQQLISDLPEDVRTKVPEKTNQAQFHNERLMCVDCGTNCYSGRNLSIISLLRPTATTKSFPSR